MNTETKYKYIECECSASEHSIRFIYFPAYLKDSPELYMSTFLAHYGFWGRLWSAIKYVFGGNCRYGHFEETVLSTKQAQEIIDLMQEYQKDSEEFRKKCETNEI